MNHKYTALLLACIAGTAQAQRVDKRSLPLWAQPERFDKTQLPGKPGGDGQAKAAGDVVFYEDFANGIAGNNGVGAWTRTGPNSDIWKWTSTGPLGGYSTNAQAIASETEANGWMIFDADRSNSDTTDAQNPEPLPVDQFVARDGYLESPVLNLTATPYVHLQFQMRARWCCYLYSIFFVDVSTDGGGSWPTRLEVTDPNQFANDDPGTYTARVNMQNAISGDLTNVKFRFAWEGSASGGDGMSHYFTQVDDVRLIESDYNDLDAKNLSYNMYAPGGVTQFAEFEMKPLSQVADFNMGSPVGNEGQYPAVNAVLTADVSRNGSAVFNGQASQALIPPGALDSTFVINYAPDEVGDYTVDLNLSSDSVDANPDNNSAALAWEITDYVYAQDDNGRDGLVNDEGNEYYACNFFWMENDATIYAIQAALANGSANTEIGGVYYGVVLDQDLVEIGLETLPSEVTSNQQLSGTNQAKFQSLMFEPPLEVSGGQELCACVHYYPGAELVTVATGGTSVVGQSLFMRANEDGQRFVQMETPMVRLNFDPSVGITDNDRQDGVGLGQNMPNPSSNSTTIPYDLTSAASVTLEVHDLSGKLIATVREGNKAPGSYRLQLDTRALNEGVYFYTLQADNTRITKRMTVIR